MAYDNPVFALTPVWAKHSMQPESSDGFASVGTILPKEKAALLPGGFFASTAALFRHRPTELLCYFGRAVEREGKG
jgi:hypothetical protein